MNTDVRRDKFEGLSRFCYVAGAKLDNNRVEQVLKLIILGRKNSLFYKTQNGADVGDILTSVLGTALANGINVFDYLVALQQNWCFCGSCQKRRINKIRARQRLKIATKVEAISLLAKVNGTAWINRKIEFRDT